MIFEQFVYLTIMLKRAFSDLFGFAVLYVVLIFLIGVINAVFGFMNRVIPGSYKDKWNEEMPKPWREEFMEGSEYIEFVGL